MSVPSDITSKLQYTPPIQLTFVDPNTGKPADGKIKFFVDGTNTPKNAYTATNNPSDPFVAVQEITLNGAGSPNVALYFFPFDEADKTTTQLYKIEVTNAAGVPVVTKVGFPPQSSSSTPQSKQLVENFMPSYGFETLTIPDRYKIGSIEDDGLPNGKNAIGLGWIWERNGSDSKKAQASVEPLNFSSITGNPKNKITLKVKNSSSDDTISRLYVRIGDYSSFQDVELLFSLNAKAVSGVGSVLNVKIFRTKAGIEQPEQTAGTITTHTAITQSSSFTYKIPTIAGQSGFSNQDGLYWSIDLPKRDFELELTASWLQESAGGLSISEDSTAKNSTSQLYASQGDNFTKDYTQSSSGLPLIATKYGISFYDISSSIYLFPKGSTIRNFYALSDNVELIRNVVKDDSTVNRLIDKLRQHNITKSTHTFIAKKEAANELSITTGLAIDQLETWTISNAGSGSRIAFKSGSDGTNNAFSMKIKASYYQSEFFVVLFNFTENGIVTSRIINPNPQGTPLFQGGYIEGEIANNSVIANYYATLSFTTPVNDSTNAQLLLQTFVNIRDPGTASTKARYVFDFYPSLFYTITEPGGDTIPGSNTEGDKNNNLFRSWDIDYPEWLRSRNVVYKSNSVNTNYVMGYMAWNGPGETPPTLPAYQYTLGFSIDGDGSPNTPTGTIEKRVVNISSEDEYASIAKKLIETINNPTVQKYIYSARPNTGDKQSIDNGRSKFDVIYVVGNDAKPLPTTGRIAIYVNIAPSDTAEQSIDKAISAIKSAVAGIPTFDKFGLPDLKDYDYYMKL